MHIALISVAPPYRGGISKQTSILVEKLNLNHSVRVINYKRQYPHCLFPGKTQYLEDELDYQLGDRCIDSINPITWLKTGEKLSARKFDLVIFRFWNPLFAPALSMIALKIRKKSPHTKLISLCDNILPHENMLFGSLLTRYLFRLLDGHLVQSGQTENELHKIIGKPIYEKRFHPLLTTYSKKIAKNEARLKLGLTDKYIILYFGIIRQYKGFDILLKAIASLKEKMNTFHVLAVGECYEKQEKYTALIDKLDISDCITWHDRYIPDDDVAMYFSAADVAALPYRSASQSGVIPIAYYYNLPVIVTKVGGLPEIVDADKSGFVIEPDNPDELSNVLAENLGTPIFDKMSHYIQSYKQQFSWELFVEGIEKLFNRI